jgi:hypothetical protein
MSKLAPIRVCASCEFVFDMRLHPVGKGCPQCSFASYGARQVYGKKCYGYLKSQKPFYNRFIVAARYQAYAEITRVRKNQTDFSLNLFG